MNLIRDENDERSARIDAMIDDLKKTKDEAARQIEESKRTIEKADALIKRIQHTLTDQIR